MENNPLFLPRKRNIRIDLYLLHLFTEHRISQCPVLYQTALGLNVSKLSVVTNFITH